MPTKATQATIMETFTWKQHRSIWWQQIEICRKFPKIWSLYCHFMLNSEVFTWNSTGHYYKNNKNKKYKNFTIYLCLFIRSCVGNLRWFWGGRKNHVVRKAGVTVAALPSSSDNGCSWSHLAFPFALWHFCLAVHRGFQQRTGRTLPGPANPGARPTSTPDPRTLEPSCCSQQSTSTRYALCNAASRRRSSQL